MSIPPLVCSTPPPPDQCEDYKDPDDFDIPYNLSQEDDDENGFGYGDFSSYNHYQSNCIIQKKDVVSVDDVVSKQLDIEVNVPESKESDTVFVTNSTNENKPKNEEDVNIEDLGLEINEESTSSCERDGGQSEENSNNEITESVIEDIATDNNTSPSLSSEEIIVESSNVESIEEPNLDNSKEISLEKPINDTSPDLHIHFSEPDTLNDEVCMNDVSPDTSDPVSNPNINDDFGDFDDFQFVSSERKDSHVIESSDNPWENNEANNNNDFGNFTANFEPDDRPPLPITVTENNDININQNLRPSATDEQDDFGDFDDFKSSACHENEIVESEVLEQDQHMSVLNLQGSDNEQQVMESITKVINSIFEQEISEAESEFQGRLESQLSETWRHLRETDVRQPYIINWNNSLGQKTLLKALCIDSRNILFGPKWGYNTPKYAVNLSAAPLQPQKPMTLSTPSQSKPVPDSSAKVGGWTDPFTADGQESCNTETESVVEVTSTDLDVFEAAISSKSDSKVYSSTLNVQPLRQISLPDTHIFTPTDSEIPTSKTVHYDTSPPILVPQAVLESSKKLDSSPTLQTIDSTQDSKGDDDDYWEFQDFKSSSDKTTGITADSAVQPPQVAPESNLDNVPKSNVTYQTQVLQPIRMEPLIPTVNWPDPGEIKETFDDFSDFISNSTRNDSPHIETSTSQTQTRIITETDVLDKIKDKHKNIATVKDSPKVENNDDFDVEFNTFQSALPSNHINTDFNFHNLSSSTFDTIPSQNSTVIPDFSNSFPKSNNVKSDIISINNPTKLNETISTELSPQVDSNTKENYNKTSIPSNSIPHGLLQPMATISISSQIKQKAGQILQPLSLESYSQINWPNPGIDLQDLSRFNPVETLQSLKSDLSVGGPSKVASPVHNQKVGNNQTADDEWGEFVSSKPKQQTLQKKPASFADDDEWTDFVSIPTAKPQNGLNTISLNVQTNSNIQKTSNLKFPTKNNQLPLDIPTLNYITPKASSHNYNDRHFQNL